MKARVRTNLVWLELPCAVVPRGFPNVKYYNRLLYGVFPNGSNGWDVVSGVDRKIGNARLTYYYSTILRHGNSQRPLKINLDIGLDVRRIPPR